MTKSGDIRALGAAGIFVVVLLLARAAAAQGPEAAPDTLSIIQEQYAQAMQSGLYGEAADATKRYIGVLLSRPAVDEAAWGEALARLGEAQRLAGDFTEAIANYALAVEVLEVANNRLDGSLMEPLIGLGRAHEDAGNYPDALRAYNRGIHVRQVNMGLFALEQAETLDRMSQIYYRMGEYDKANDLQQAYAGIYAQNFPDDFLKQVPAQLSRANMLNDTDKLFDAKLAFKRTIDKIEAADSRRSLALLPVIYSFADMMQNKRIVDDTYGLDVARRFYRKAVFIAEKNEDATPEIRAEAYIKLGDFFVTSIGHREKAISYYTKAWAELSSDERYFELRAAQLEHPTLLNPAPGNMPPGMRRLLMLSKRDAAEKDARLIIRYDIDEFGHAVNIAVAQGDPVGHYDTTLTRYIEIVSFRPGFVDGQPARFENLSHVIEYPSNELYVDLGQNRQQSEVN